MALTATLTANPWRFKVGDLVYIAGQPQFKAKVTAAFGHGRRSWPHYLVTDYKGVEWRCCQIELSKSPILP